MDQTQVRTARDLALLIALTVALHAPFVEQAFHLDDVQYLDIARNVFRNPLFPLDLPAIFQGVHVTLWGHTHPPLNAYLVAGLTFLHGGFPSEIFLHSSFLFFPILITVSFYFLAQRFAVSPLLASALLGTNPTLMVSAHTLMADVPHLALWLCGTVLFVKGIDKDKGFLVYASGLPITAACFYAYQGLALLPLLAFYAISRKRLRWREIQVLVAPVLLMTAWQFSGYVHRGVMYASTMFGYVAIRGLWQGTTKVRTAIACLTYLGGTILPFPFIFWKMRRNGRGALPWAALAVAVCVSYQKLIGYTWPEQLFFIGSFGGGLTAAVWIVSRGIKSWSLEGWAADDIFLCLWFVGMLIGCIGAFFSGSARYLLPACPALLLLLMRGVNRTRFFYSSILVVQLILGLLLSHSDYEFAGIGRREARDFKSLYLAEPRPFLFSGEWGLRYYLTSMGGEILAEDTVGTPGELVVKSPLALGQSFDNSLNRSLQTVEQRTYGVRSPLRLLDPRTHAGFWSDGWGVLPFSFSWEMMDELTIYQVR